MSRRRAPPGNKSAGRRPRRQASVNLISMSTSSYWGLRDIAEYLGVEYSSARTYHGRSEIHRRTGETKPGDMPPPDGRFGNSPVWLKDRIISWLDTRPGKGVGGGRPTGQLIDKHECPTCGRRVGVTKEGLPPRGSGTDGEVRVVVAHVLRLRGFESLLPHMGQETTEQFRERKRAFMERHDRWCSDEAWEFLNEKFLPYDLNSGLTWWGALTGFEAGYKVGHAEGYNEGYDEGIVASEEP
jgi:hypothetical protein